MKEWNAQIHFLTYEKIFAYETFLKAYKVRWNNCFVLKNPFGPIGSQWKFM